MNKSGTHSLVPILSIGVLLISLYYYFQQGLLNTIGVSVSVLLYLLSIVLFSLIKFIFVFVSFKLRVLWCLFLHKCKDFYTNNIKGNIWNPFVSYKPYNNHLIPMNVDSKLIDSYIINPIGNIGNDRYTGMGLKLPQYDSNDKTGIIELLPSSINMKGVIGGQI